MKWLHKDNSNDNSEEIDLSKLDDVALENEFKQALEVYGRGVNSQWPLSIPAIDDAMTVVSARDYLSDLISQGQKRNLTFNLEAVKQLDTEWQSWILLRVPIDVRQREPLYDDKKAPDTKWWLHIERLDQIALEDRKSF